MAADRGIAAEFHQRCERHKRNQTHVFGGFARSLISSHSNSIKAHYTRAGRHCDDTEPHDHTKIAKIVSHSAVVRMALGNGRRETEGDRRDGGACTSHAKNRWNRTGDAIAFFRAGRSARGAGETISATGRCHSGMTQGGRPGTYEHSCSRKFSQSGVHGFRARGLLPRPGMTDIHLLRMTGGGGGSSLAAVFLVHLSAGSAAGHETALPPCRMCPRASEGSVALALHALAQELAIAAHRFGPLAGTALRGFLIAAPQFHLPEHTLALHLFLQGPESLIDIVVADEDLHGGSLRSEGSRPQRPAAAIGRFSSTCGPHCEAVDRKRPL